MTTPQGQVPPPPEGYASWLDCLIDGPLMRARYDLARAELAALRKELSDAKAERDERTMRYWSAAEERDAARKELSNTHGLLAQARENLVAIDAQRAEAVEEREKYRHAARQFCGGHVGITQTLCPACERDALRDQVAELREAALKLGTLTDNPKVYPSCDDGYDYPVQAVLSSYRRADWNAHVATLLSEPKEEEKKP